MPNLNKLNEALIQESKEGNLEEVKLLLNKGADVHADDDEALLIASEKGNLDVVKLLLNKGADVHALDDGPLQLATDKGHLDVVKELELYTRATETTMEDLQIMIDYKMNVRTV